MASVVLSRYIYLAGEFGLEEDSTGKARRAFAGGADLADVTGVVMAASEFDLDSDATCRQSGLSVPTKH
jgi:hypothetical protein